jgi:hypothetical protein
MWQNELKIILDSTLLITSLCDIFTSRQSKFAQHKIENYNKPICQLSVPEIKITFISMSLSVPSKVSMSHSVSDVKTNHLGVILLNLLFEATVHTKL